MVGTVKLNFFCLFCSIYQLDGLTWKHGLNSNFHNRSPRWMRKWWNSFLFFKSPIFPSPRSIVLIENFIYFWANYINHPEVAHESPAGRCTLSRESKFLKFGLIIFGIIFCFTYYTQFSWYLNPYRKSSPSNFFSNQLIFYTKLDCILFQ